MPLNRRQLEIVRAISRYGSVTGAAIALGITQPAVSMMLREANRNAGFPLFARKHGRLQPTSETAVIMADLDRLFDGIDRINRLVSEMKDVNIGTVQISATPTLAENLLPRALLQLQKSRPNVQVTIHTMNNNDVVTSVVEEHVDLGLTLAPLGHVEARSIELCEVDLICVVNRQNPLVGRATVTLRDLAPYPLISFSRNLPLGQLVERCFQKAGLRRRIAFEVNQSSTACALVQIGVEVAIIDAFWLMDQRSPDLCRMTLLPRTKVAAHALVPQNTTMSRPARLLLQAIESAAADLTRRGRS
jgi:DNA-binding transcriptional LysR family regulator